MYVDEFTFRQLIPADGIQAATATSAINILKYFSTESDMYFL